MYKDGFLALPVVSYNNYYGVETVSKSAGEVITNTSNKEGWVMLGGVELGKEDKILVEVEVTG